MHERIEAIVTGRVQRVMFRDFACRKGRALGLVGSAKNLRDGTVLVVAEGSRRALEALLIKLHKGSLLARVESVAMDWQPARGGLKGFVIEYE